MTIGAIRKVAGDFRQVDRRVWVRGAPDRLLRIVNLGRRFVTVAIDGVGQIRVPSDDVVNVC